MDTYIPFFGRLCMCALFFNSVFSKISDPGGLMTTLAEKGIPLPEVTAWVVIIVELVSPILILIGYKTRWAALALVLWLVPVTIVMHPISDAKQKGNFLNNFALVGGLLFVAKAGAGKWSVDRSATG